MLKINTISGNIIDVLNEKIYGGTIYIENGRIVRIVPTAVQQDDRFILPGFIDAHVHIESSMLTPVEFGRMAVVHGTVATISDPHEIANVLGLEGILYMMENARQTPLKIHFGAPPCVPATTFETAGAIISTEDIETLFRDHADIKYMSEMMNWPGVLFADPDIMAKIALAKQYNRPIDGHAPGLRGEDARKYIAAGISTDHECFTLAEALDKIQAGMKIIIREGSAAKNFEALSPLIDQYADRVMFCSDDKHPNDLIVGHINQLVRRAVEQGHNVMKVLRCACVNPVKHYSLNVGLLQEGDPADFIVVDNLRDFHVKQTYIDGQLMAENGHTFLSSQTAETPNNFQATPKKSTDFAIKAAGNTLRVMEALEGQLVTNCIEISPINTDENGCVLPDIRQDILKIAVINRYNNAPPAIGFIKNFGLKNGAIASSVAHDSHNIIVVGTSDEAICSAVNLIIEAKGGLAAFINPNEQAILPLPLAGIMSIENGWQVAEQYIQLDKMAKKMGSKLYAPYMTLSFMALLVIPQLKLSDKGLFDGQKFEFTSLFA